MRHNGGDRDFAHLERLVPLAMLPLAMLLAHLVNENHICALQLEGGHSPLLPSALYRQLGLAVLRRSTVLPSRPLSACDFN